MAMNTLTAVVTAFLLPLVQAQLPGQAVFTGNLTCSTPYQQQAIGSSIVVSCTCFTGNRPPPLLEWRIDNKIIGFAGFRPGTNRLEAPHHRRSSNILDYLNRVNISVSGSNVSFTTQLALFGLKSDDDGVEIALKWPNIQQRIMLLNVTNCPSNFESNVAVRSSRPAVFQSSGMFDCSNNGELFYSNGSMLTNTDTVCLASAEWSGQGNVQCWSAPVTTIASSLTVIEGNNLTLTCDYNDTVPTGDSTKFYIGDTSNTTRKGESLTLRSVGRNDNHKIISCQALTPYTRIRGNAGRSLNYSLNVQYAPYQAQPIPSQTWGVNQVGQFTVTFMSNPQAKYISLTKNRTLVTNDIPNKISSNDVIQSYQFLRSVVSHADKGRYVLTVQSSVFLNNYTISFDVDVVGNLPPNPKSNQSLIIGVSCAAVVIVILLILVIVMIIRKRRLSKKKEISPSTNRVHDEAERVENTNPLYDSGLPYYTKVDKPTQDAASEKEERINPLYGSSHDQKENELSNINTNINKGSHEKEVKLNPLYGGSYTVEEANNAYAEVDIKKDEKEERVNPLYVPSTSDDPIVEGYGEVDNNTKTAAVMKNEHVKMNEARYSLVKKPKKKQTTSLSNGKQGGT